MAYPNLITGTGPIGTNTDIFTWWRDSFLAREAAEGFGNEFTPVLAIFPTFPFNRSAFHSWVNSSYGYPPEGSGSPYYSFATPGVGWDNREASHWGTVKSLELTLFGNVANGGSTGTSTLSKYVAGDSATMGASKWAHHDMVYLRYALRQFGFYGDCIDEYFDDEIGYPLISATIHPLNKMVFPTSNPLGGYDIVTPIISSYSFPFVPNQLSILVGYKYNLEDYETYLGFPTFQVTSSGTTLGVTGFNIPNLPPDGYVFVEIMNITPNIIVSGGETIVLNF